MSLKTDQAAIKTAIELARNLASEFLAAVENDDLMENEANVTLMDDLISAIGNITTATAAVTYPPVTVDGTDYIITVAEAIVNGDLMTAEEIASDSVLCGDLIESGSKIIALVPGS